jgi:predicted ATP-grasp superfamily ATP-dependent carboligase
MKRVFVYEYLSAGGDVGDPQAGATLLPAGVAMRDAIVADLLALPDCAVSVATGPSAPPPAGGAPVRHEPGETALGFVARVARQHDLVWLVAPETDGLLEACCRAVGSPRWLGCDAATIALATSKQATLQRLAGAGLATPLDFESDVGTSRWVVKPDDGAGAVATHVHADRGAAHDAAALRRAAGEAVVVEPWVDGEALSASLLCGRDGTELLSVNRQCIRIDTRGQVHDDGVQVHVAGRDDPRHAAIGSIVARVARALPGLRGFVGIDLVWHAGRGPVLIELNPRTTCAYVGLSLALRRNLAGAVLAAHAEDLADAAA